MNLSRTAFPHLNWKRPERDTPEFHAWRNYVAGIKPTNQFKKGHFEGQEEAVEMAKEIINRKK